MKLILLMTTLFLIACTENQHTENSWIYEADPQEDFEAAISKEDYRFRGVYGYSLSVPHLRLRCFEDVEKEVNPIEGTSDSYDNYSQAKFNAVARLYADHYNFKMLEYRKSNQGFECGS